MMALLSAVETQELPKVQKLLSDKLCVKPAHSNLHQADKQLHKLFVRTTFALTLF